MVCVNHKYKKHEICIIVVSTFRTYSFTTQVASCFLYKKALSFSTASNFFLSRGGLQVWYWLSVFTATVCVYSVPGYPFTCEYLTNCVVDTNAASCSPCFLKCVVSFQIIENLGTLSQFNTVKTDHTDSVGTDSVFLSRTLCPRPPVRHEHFQHKNFQIYGIQWNRSMQTLMLLVLRRHVAELFLSVY